MNQVFSVVLMKRAELGLIKGDMFAVDGCKLPSKTCKGWSGTLEDFAQKKAGWEKPLKRLAEQQKTVDKAEEKQGKLNETCQKYVEDKEMRERHIKRVTKKLEKLNAFLASHPVDKLGASGQPVQNNITDEESAKIKGPHGYIQGYNGIAAADSANQVIVAAEAFGSGPEAKSFPDMLDLMDANMKAVTGKEKPLENALVEADTGDFSEENLREAAKRNIEVLIPDQQFRKRDEQFACQKDHHNEQYYSLDKFTHNDNDDSYTCPNGKKLMKKNDVTLRGKLLHKWMASHCDCKDCPFKDKCMRLKDSSSTRVRKVLLVPERNGKENLSQAMRDKIDNPAYRILYGQRMRIIEPCFSDITYCKGMNRFTVRGQAKVNIQWLLYCTVHNIAKCIKPMAVKYAF
jgi:hypothetical protein